MLLAYAYDIVEESCCREQFEEGRRNRRVELEQLLATTSSYRAAKHARRRVRSPEMGRPRGAINAPGS